MLTELDIAAEWRRRAARDGLAAVMRASQPAGLNVATTEATRRLVGDLLAELGRPETALEVGCGIGRITPTIAASARRVVSMDMTPEMLAQARRNCGHLSNVDFIRYEAEHLPLHRVRFDVAVSVWVLMHVLTDNALARVGRALAASTRHLVLVEYEQAAIPVGEYSRLRSLDDYLAVLPNSRLLRREELDYGGDRSFAALIALD